MDIENTLQSLMKIDLFNNLESMPIITDEPKIPGYLCFPNQLTREEYCVKEDTYGQGFDRNPELAKVKSIAEFLERLMLYNPSRKLLKGKYKPNTKKVDPGIFCCYSEEQIENREEFLEKIKEQNYKWFPVKDLLNKKVVNIPAQMVFLSDDLNLEFPIRRERISTGAAFGRRGKEQALKNGLLEVIERDSCISKYLKREPLTELKNFDKEINGLIDYLRRYRLETHVFDMTSDLKVPTTMTVTLDYTGIGDAINIGTKSSLDFKDSIIGSILESIQRRNQGRIFRELNKNEKYPNEDEIFSMYDRCRYWEHIDRIKDLDWWIRGSKKRDYKKSKQDKTNLVEIIKTLKNKKYNLFIADIGNRKIKSNGFEVLKVIIPELHPLYLDERAKMLYSEHYKEIKEDLKLKPHPFP
jgi:thiazole/oxazole-forming peptide maturase SagD family component